MKKALLSLLFLASLSSFGKDAIAKEEEHKLEVLRNKGSGLLCPYSFGKDVFISKSELTVLRKVNGEVRYYVVLPKGKVVPLSSCVVVKKVSLKEEKK